MIIRNATRHDRDRWNMFVNSHKDASPYHLYEWAKTVEQCYGFKCLNLLVEQDDRIIAILPLTRFRLPFGKLDLVSQPYCDVGGPLTLKKECENIIYSHLLDFAINHNVSSIQIRGSLDINFDSNHRSFIRTNAEKVRMLLALPKSSDELWKQFRSKLRSQIRRAEKNDLTVQLSRDNVEDFYKVFSQNMRDLGSPVHSKKWIQAMLTNYGGNAIIGVVYHRNTPIGAGITLRGGNTMSIPWASTLKKFNKLAPNMILYWKLLEYAIESKCKVFDFGRSTPNGGTFKFKQQWGAQPVSLAWHTIKLTPFKEEKRPIQLKVMDRRDLAASVWGNLPLSMANFMGPYLRKYISL